MIHSYTHHQFVFRRGVTSDTPGIYAVVFSSALTYWGAVSLPSDKGDVVLWLTRNQRFYKIATFRKGRLRVLKKAPVKPHVDGGECQISDNSSGIKENDCFDVYPLNVMPVCAQ